MDWRVTPGEIIEFFALVVAWWTLREGNKQMHQANIQRFQELETKVGVMYEAFMETYIRRRGGTD